MKPTPQHTPALLIERRRGLLSKYPASTISDYAVVLDDALAECRRLSAQQERLVEALQRAELALAVAASQFAGHDLTRHEVCAEDCRKEAAEARAILEQTK